MILAKLGGPIFWCCCCCCCCVLVPCLLVLLVVGCLLLLVVGCLLLVACCWLLVVVVAVAGCCCCCCCCCCVVGGGAARVSHDSPRPCKRVHLRVPALAPPKFNEKTPRERRKSEISDGRRTESAKFWAPTLWGPPSGPSGPHQWTSHPTLPPSPTHPPRSTKTGPPTTTHTNTHTHNTLFSHLNFGMPCLCLAPMSTHTETSSSEVAPLTPRDWLSRKHSVSRPWLQ